MSSLGSSYDKALRLLTRRPHFRQELERKLASRGFPPEEVRATLDRLQEQGYLDDRRCALDMATGSLRRKGFGPRRVRAELARRGVDEEVIEEAVAVSFPEGELGRARELAGRWIGSRDADPGKLARHLDRKGYSKGVILQLLDEIPIRSSDH